LGPAAAFDSFRQSEAVATTKAEDGVKDATMRIFLEVE
jgi:hypothetical protein